MPPAPPTKKDVMLALLERAEARVHLDTRRPGVQLPARFLGQAHLRLDYGYKFTPPIPDLQIGDDGIRATLSFNRVPFATFVPWSAVFVIADFEGNGAVWQEDVPADLETAAPPAPGAPATSGAPPRRLQSVPAEAAPPPPETAPPPAEAAPAAETAPSGDAPSPVGPTTSSPPADGDERREHDEPPEPPANKPRPSHLKLVK